MMTYRSSLSRRSHAVAAVVLLLAASLGGCAGVAVGAGATVATATMEERPLTTVATDTKLAAQIRINLINTGEEFAKKIGVEVFEGRALLTGAVPNDAMRAESVKQAWKVTGVKDVINEVQVSDSGLVDLARDSWVTTQLKTRMTLDKEVLAINYSVETVNGTVYLIGIAQSPAELERVTAHAKSIGYVRNIISHVRVKQAKS